MVDIKTLQHCSVLPQASGHGGVHYLKEDIRCIVQTHDHCASSYHVVSVGECDEQYGGQVVDEHDHEILQRGRERDRNSMTYRAIK